MPLVLDSSVRETHSRIAHRASPDKQENLQCQDFITRFAHQIYISPCSKALQPRRAFRNSYLTRYTFRTNASDPSTPSSRSYHGHKTAGKFAALGMSPSTYVVREMCTVAVHFHRATSRYVVSGTALFFSDFMRNQIWIIPSTCCTGAKGSDNRGECFNFHPTITFCGAATT